MHSNFRRIGNTLIILSCFGLLLISLPFFLSYLPSHKLPLKEGYGIAIPKIHAESPIVPGVDPWNQSAYKKALRLGVAQAKGTSLPGQQGLIYLFAHSSGMPWEILGTNIPFLRLGELNKGDAIFLYKDTKQFPFTVVEKKVVSVSETAYLAGGEANFLILQTCWPIGTDFQRLLIFARPSL